MVEYPLVFANVANMKLEINSDTSTSIIHSNDRAFNYGDGFFTTMRCVDQKIQLFDLHLQRLQSDAKRLFVEINDWSGLIKALKQTANKASEDCVVKVHISLGEGGRGYSRDMPSKPRALIKTSPLPEDIDEMTLSVGQGYLSDQSMLAGIKHCNRLEQVLLKRQADELGIDDVICLDSKLHVVETSSANLFWFNHGRWYTPSLTRCGVNGVYRQFVLSLFAKFDIDISIGDYLLDNLVTAESVFACNAVRGVMPIKQLNYPLESQHSFSDLPQHLCNQNVIEFTNSQLPALQTRIKQHLQTIESKI